MSDSEWFSLLGLANRARKVVSGEDLVVKEIRHSRAKLVLLAKDVSFNTEKKVTDKCKYYNVPFKTVGDRLLLGRSIGKESRVVVAVTDQGFANTLLRKLD
ncbi:YlxQ family RNA-binding protein [Bacillus sp. WMMC1349]|uniref:YlxQ family RNA-binding protein n=1 Tax=Bacillus TaxID=1386 RepID=UPI0015563D14|nr:MULTISPECIES: YlxQ family RNA-binding protein [Bacillus]MDA1475500.1 YlxQ family RNA-binding protein [Bacillus changyiensis]NPC92616.1 YlxQ family RNA-binding protein [Bacillus sp. WMMC1349]